MVGIAILLVIVSILIYFGIDLYKVSQRKKEKEQNKLKLPEQLSAKETRSNVSLATNLTPNELEDELVDMILELHPHIQPGNRLTCPVGITYQGRNPTQQDYEYIESLDMLSQVKAVTTLAATAFKIKLPFDVETIKSLDLSAYKYIHPYQLINMMPENLKVGMTVNSLDPVTLLPVAKVFTQEEYDEQNFVVFRCAFS